MGPQEEREPQFYDWGQRPYSSTVIWLAAIIQFAMGGFCLVAAVFPGWDPHVLTRVAGLFAGVVSIWIGILILQRTPRKARMSRSHPLTRPTPRASPPYSLR